MNKRRKHFLDEMFKNMDADHQARGLGGMDEGLVLRAITSAMALMSDQDVEDALGELHYWHWDEEHFAPRLNCSKPNLLGVQHVFLGTTLPALRQRPSQRPVPHVYHRG